MNRGFFANTITVEKEREFRVPQCGSCGLYLHCRSPKMEADGEGRKRILLIGEAPGKWEDDEGVPFVGKAGDVLWRLARKVGLERNDCWVTNAIICRPTKGGKGEGEEEGNRKPTDKEIRYCRPNLTATIERLQPDVIITLGGVPTKSLIDKAWGVAAGAISRWVGFQIPCRVPNTWICPTYHPSYLAREQSPVLDLMFKRHLKAAVKLSGKPWDVLPDYRRQVRVMLDPGEAAAAIQRFNGLVAFDFETDRKKPDHPDSEIVCCAVSDGKVSIAYPWVGKAIEATKNLLASDLPKIGFNAKFETRWAKVHLGKIRNWVWDGMLGAHTIDTRSDITGLEFQVFALLGHPSWDAAVRPYLTSSGGGNEKNRIRECPLKELLLYCGLDSLFEWLVGHIQMKKMGVWRW